MICNKCGFAEGCQCQEVADLKAENKKILHMHGVNEAFEGYRAELKESKKQCKGWFKKTQKLREAIKKIDVEILKTWEFLMRENNPNASSFLKIHRDLQKALENKCSTK